MSGPIILGLETSCDETAIGVVRGGVVLSNVLSSQVDEHARFGGVVPEVAARAHVEAIRSLTHRALRDAGIHQLDVDAVAATRGPGLAGALMVGFSYGKALAWALDQGLIAGAALDVYEHEPAIHPALLPLENVLLVPHLGSATTETRTAMAALAIENVVAVLSGRSRFSLQALPPSDFPDLAAGEFSHRFTLPAADLKFLIDKARFAISTEETRYYLNGIYLHHVEAGGTARLRAVATDGHRLAQVEVEAPEGSAGMPGIIVPRKTVLELVKLIEDTEAGMEVALSASKIRFLAASLTLTSKLIDGTFPDYERVIPKHNDKQLEVDIRLFTNAVDRVSTISSEKGRAVKLNIAADKVVLSVNNPESGSAEEELAATYSAEPLDIGFNSRYLLDIASQFKGDSARFEFADAGSPTIVRDTADERALYVLMPMRV